MPLQRKGDAGGNGGQNLMRADLCMACSVAFHIDLSIVFTIELNGLSWLLAKDICLVNLILLLPPPRHLHFLPP